MTIHPKMQVTFVGVDSHKATHCAVFLNCFFEKLGEITFENAPGKFPAFLKKAEKMKVEGTNLMFALEDISVYGRTLAVFLREKGYDVKHANANLVAQERTTHTFSNKSDSIDAECAARVLLSKFGKLPEVDPQDKYWILKSLVIYRQSLVKNNTALKSQLYALITAHYPSYRKFFVDIDCKSSLAFLKKYPSPVLLKGTTVNELYEFLHEESRWYWGMDKAEQILECVEKDGDTSCCYQEIRDDIILSTIAQMETNIKELSRVGAIIKKSLCMFDYNLTSMKGIDTVSAAQLIANIGDIRRFPTAAKLANYAGISPVTHSSGEKEVQYANHRGNRELNSLFYNLALRVSMITGPKKRVINPYFFEYYHKKISEGKTKRQALKCVERRLVNIIWHMMKFNEEYINPPSYNLKESE